MVVSLCSILPADRQTGRLNWYKQTLFFAFLMICSTFITPQQSYGQGWDIRLSDALGNAQVVSWPPHDTTYSPNTVIIKFKRSALRLENLCYTYDFNDNLVNKAKNSETQMGLLTYNQKIYLFSQRFTPHEVTSDSLLANAMLAIGIDTLRRLTSANPCEDTISISILGDTVDCLDYLYFEGILSNDTSVLSSSSTLTYSFQNSLYYVEPNFIRYLTNIPSDARYSDNQKAFQPQLMDIQSAWVYEVGLPEIQIAVIDNGIEFDKCEFNRGEPIGPNQKVSYGFNYVNPQNYNGIRVNATHGTGVASLAAALTNRNTSFCHDGMAGVAGGWGEDNGYTDKGKGCEIYALKTGEGRFIYESQSISAIFESSSNNPRTGYGNQADIINCSYKGNTPSMSENEAVQYALINGLSLVASRANDADTNKEYPNKATRQNYWTYSQQIDGALAYPACYEEHLVTCVGAAGERHPDLFFNTSYQKDRVRYSNFGRLLDFTVATGERRWHPNYNPVSDLNIWAINSERSTPPYDQTGGWEQCDGTSASAGIVSGIFGLLRSYAVNHGFFNVLEPEDYQGILKASAEDRQGNRGHNNHLEDFDIYSGWGHINVGDAFRMLEDGYRIFKSSTQAVTFGNWVDHPLKQNNANYTVQFAKATEWNASQLIGKHRVKVRTVTGQVVTPNNIDYFEPIYSWGVSGRGGSTGWSLANPQMQYGYSVILGNEGGNNIIPGIIHHRGGNYTQTGIFEATTFQYAILDSNDSIVRLLPPTEMLGVNVSIFAKQVNPMSVAKGNVDDSHLVYPSIAKDVVTIQWKEIETSICQVRIRSLLGEIVSYVEIEPSHSITPKQIDVSKLPIGTYFVEVVTGNKVNSYKVMIVR